MIDRFTPEEVESIARRAGLALTHEWRAALVEGSRFVVQVTARLRPERALSVEPAHVFVAPQPRPR